MKNQSTFYFQASARSGFPFCGSCVERHAQTPHPGVSRAALREWWCGGLWGAAKRPDTMHVLPRYIGLLAGDSPVNALRDLVQRSRSGRLDACTRG